MARRLGTGALLLVLLLPWGTAGAEDTAADALYVRDLASPRGVVRWLEDEARRIHAVQVLVAFEITSIAPPPDAGPLARHEAPAAEVPRWLDALGVWSATGTCPVRVTTSLNPRSVAVGEAGWRARAEVLMRHPWWEDDGIPRLESAARWMKRYLQRTDCVLQDRTTRSPRMLVYVAGRRLPERILATPPAGVPAWRRKLLHPGDAFEPEAVAGLLEKRGARLYVVSPEAFLGKHVPYRELPVLPWTSRPRLLPHDLAAGDEVLGIREGGALRLRQPAVDEAVRRFLEELGARGSGVLVGPTGGAGADRSLLITPHESPRRFLGAPPLYFDFDPQDGHLVTCDHTPSGFGTWCYARAVAESGGRYVLYPRCRPPLDDPLPRDDALLDRLAPELVHRSSFLKRRAGDPALELMCRLATRLARVTPTGLAAVGGPVETAWSDYERARPLRLVRRAPRRRCPLPAGTWPPFRHPLDAARHVRDDVLPVYEDARRRVERALAAIDRGEDERSHPRSVANLRKLRFDVALSAFHLRAYVTAVLALGDARAPWGGAVGTNRLTRMLPAIRLSDCLEAYDGRTISPAEEATFGGWTPREDRGYQGNLLGVPPTDPAFRARRDLARVFRRLDPSLRAHALQVIRAAADVMAHLGRTPWGWSVYYTDAYTFSFPPR